ncbi:CDK5 regulatory subunit-associated protein 3 [Bacillus rossius redtenbacheri]|uniref:CDK5 regulatory subunit-associated protein 3 n=1 Tax=Bacillus rossius redtenbacheri TaxID=93214 RepID=UPI002FDD79E0
MQERDIPIDISTNKLLDWLVSRRLCGRDWQAQVLDIRAKINNAIQDMPAHPGITRLLSGAYINYFHCKKIMEILKETEADSKNLFGSYGSQRMKDWQEVVRLYEKDNVYLAEAAQMLVRNVNYEVPGMKKQIAKLEQFLAECDKKELDYGKAASAARGEFQALCKQLGIPGQRIKRELAERVRELPSALAAVAGKMKSLDPAVRLYSQFVQFVLGSEYQGGVVPLLRHVIENGNTTTYEWIHKVPPVAVEEPPLNITFDDDADGADESNDTIDFGDFDNAGSDSGIDFGKESMQESGEVDWGIKITSADGITNETADISVEGSGIEVESSGVEGGVARGEEAYTVMDNPATKNTLLDDLKELEAFLKVRLAETSQQSGDLLSLSLLQDAPAALQMQSAAGLAAMLAAVQDVICDLSDQRIQHLHSVKHSPRYVDTLADSLKQKLAAVEKMTASQEAVRRRRADARLELAALAPKLQLVISKTRQLQEEIEQDISKKYKNREVNLMGGIKTL